MLARAPRFSIRRKVLLGFAVALMMLGAIALAAWQSTRSFLRTAALVAHSREVLETQEALRSRLLEGESGVRGYLLTGSESFLGTRAPLRKGLEDELRLLEVLVAENRNQMKLLASLRELIGREMGLMDEIVAVRQREGMEAATMALVKSESDAVMTRIRTVLALFQREERELLAQRAQLTRSLGRATTVVSAGGVLVACVVLAGAFYVILRDIAWRGRAEELLAEERNLLSSVIDTIRDHIYVKDMKGRYVIDNTAHRDYVAAKNLTEVEGRTVFDFFPEELARRYHADDESVFETGAPVVNREEPALDRAGRLVWLSTTKVALRDTDGRMTGLVCVSADISERKAAEEQAAVFAQQLERSNAELQSFASVASHDLQEPLRKIQAFGDRLRKKCAGGLGEAGLDYLGRMDNAARRMQALIQDLLALSRISSRAQPFAPVDLNMIVREVVEDLEVRIEQCGAEVELGTLPEIEADALQMRQLFQNLISNALKFQRPGERPIVHVQGRLLEARDRRLPGAEPGDAVCAIHVTDNGIGFDEKYVEQIFTLFQRLHGRQEYEGTGIGLAICRKIAERHGGEISAKSAPGEGATFVVTLPVEQQKTTGNE